MLSKSHLHFKPLVNSLIYFSSSGLALCYIASKIPSISVFVYGIAGLSFVVAILALKSIFFESPLQYHGVFSLDTQKRIRALGLLAPWFIAIPFVFFGSQISDLTSVLNKQILTTKYKLFKKVKAEKIELLCSRVSHQLLMGRQADMKARVASIASSKGDLAYSIYYWMKRRPHSSALLKLSKQLPDSSQIESLRMAKPIYGGLTRKMRYIKLSQKVIIEHSSKKFKSPLVGEFCYQVGLRSKTYKPAVVKVIPNFDFEKQKI